jgi:hypothetical protein
MEGVYLQKTGQICSGVFYTDEDILNLGADTSSPSTLLGSIKLSNKHCKYYAWVVVLVTLYVIAISVVIFTLGILRQPFVYTQIAIKLTKNDNT